jgi:3-isopropylmalate/(R)-2-methylmalate dehydratase small subunit
MSIPITSLGMPGRPRPASPAADAQRSALTDALTTRGRVWKLGDDVSSDLLISAEHVYEYDPQVLRKHLLHDLRPELAAEVNPGDVIVAGRRFAHGSQHSHPFLAMKDMGLGLVAVQLTRAPFRLAVYMGVPVLEAGPEVVDALNDGDRVEIDYARGTVANTTTGTTLQARPLPDFLLRIVQAGGGLAWMREHAHDDALTG